MAVALIHFLILLLVIGLFFLARRLWVLGLIDYPAVVHAGIPKRRTNTAALVT